MLFLCRVCEQHRARTCFSDVHSDHDMCCSHMQKKLAFLKYVSFYAIHKSILIQTLFLVSRFATEINHLNAVVSTSFFHIVKGIYESQRQKTYLLTWAPYEDSNQPVHPCCIIKVFISRERKFASLAIQNAPSEDSDQPAHSRRLIWIFAGRTCPNVRLLTWRLVHKMLRKAQKLYLYYM